MDEFTAANIGMEEDKRAAEKSTVDMEKMRKDIGEQIALANQVHHVRLCKLHLAWQFEHGYGMSISASAQGPAQPGEGRPPGRGRDCHQSCMRSHPGCLPPGQGVEADGGADHGAGKEAVAAQADFAVSLQCLQSLCMPELNAPMHVSVSVWTIQCSSLAHAVQAVVRQAMSYLDQIEDKDTMVSLAKTLQAVTEGKVGCCPCERRRAG
eukprot:scaffold14353_cov18-Tisochrysis_lutea.AAC.1